MATVSWPSTLPEAPASWDERATQVNVSTSTDSGPGKVRRRFTAPVRRVSFSFLLTIEQREILRAHWETTMNMGANKTYFVNPQTGATVELLIKESPAFTNEGPLGVNAALSGEYL